MTTHTHWSSQPLSARLAAQTWRWYDIPDGPQAVAAWLTSLGCACAWGEGDTLHIQGSAGVRTALLPPSMGDPVTVTIGLAFALLGALWPQVVPELLGMVSAEWRRRNTKEKA